MFLLIFAWALQQCSATALPVIRRARCIAAVMTSQCGKGFSGNDATMWLWVVCQVIALQWG